MCLGDTGFLQILLMVVSSDYGQTPGKPPFMLFPKKKQPAEETNAQQAMQKFLPSQKSDLGTAPPREKERCNCADAGGVVPCS